MGNQILAQAAKDAGAKAMFGYPITPSTEILETWAKFASQDPSLSFLQTEDEMAAGFAMIGAVLAGKKAFSATAGPGNVLMQDAFSIRTSVYIGYSRVLIGDGTNLRSDLAPYGPYHQLRSRITLASFQRH